LLIEQRQSTVVGLWLTPKQQQQYHHTSPKHKPTSFHLLT